VSKDFHHRSCKSDTCFLSCRATLDSQRCCGEDKEEAKALGKGGKKEENRRGVKHTYTALTLSQCYDSVHRLDLERELDDRNLPDKFGRVTCDDTSHKQIKTSANHKSKLSAAAVVEAAAVATVGDIKWSTKEVPVGRALVSSHHLRCSIPFPSSFTLSSRVHILL
jgi:hypothetical protein